MSPDLRVGKSHITSEQIIDNVAKSAKLVITGTAGSGKSLFMRNAFLDFVSSGKRFVPVFIELRNVNENSDKSLKAHILTDIQRIVQSVTEDLFELGLRGGVFAFFLDGFDEIDYKLSKKIEKELLALSSAYPKCGVIISSRPDERFFSWQEFSVCKILPMSKEKIVQLVEKIEYEDIVKRKFVERIKGDLYNTHEEFLSNPLLATIMLLTFEQVADIPEKMHVFYQQAFETLFHRHDATKEMYSRARYTSYPIDEFKRYLGAFCLARHIVLHVPRRAW